MILAGQEGGTIKILQLKEGDRAILLKEIRIQILDHSNMESLFIFDLQLIPNDKTNSIQVLVGLNITALINLDIDL